MIMCTSSTGIVSSREITFLKRFTRNDPLFKIRIHSVSHVLASVDRNLQSLLVRNLNQIDTYKLL